MAERKRLSMPEHKDSQTLWLAWVEQEYPFDARWERYLLKRQSSQRCLAGSPDELRDLHGVRDRELAANFASIWAKANPFAAAAIRRGEKFQVYVPGQSRSAEQSSFSGM
jgi:hypothetical protein